MSTPTRKLQLAGGTLVGPLTGSSGVIEQRNGSTTQVFRLYNTYTDSSNYERLGINHTSGQIELAAETAGTGTDNINLLLTPAGTGIVDCARPIRTSSQFRTDAINSYDNGYTMLQNVAGVTKLYGNGYAVLTAGSAGLALGLATGDKVGFYGVTPVVQQVLETGAGRTVDEVISFLQTIGICKQS